ncbi:Acetyl-coenzyme A synthetase [Fundidesulfovibrio magnetotacticus]|uniref:acetate--CoA ligase n=1 Tax=Fundidesulfovibrio magnetotacticus TaxID=2730080 RepID=A0A6V8M2K6_9BACT|nr:AMP-binding protein [Fundidesulfovibrio magnetotacticus]GFK94675.1 Acetyl-coenzyme A synthetase [Fundidesulfovibrio magnetotacticus]
MNHHDRERFWAERARELVLWSEPWTRACPTSMEQAPDWFEGASLDVSANCLDRHLAAGRADVPALIWQGEPEGDAVTLTYAGLSAEVRRASVVLAGLGVSKGDVVGLSLPALPELVVAMLALARLGAVHLVFPAGLSPAVVSERLEACRARLFITADGCFKAGRAVAVSQPDGGPRRVIVRRTGQPLENARPDDLWWSELMDAHPTPPFLPAAVHGARDPLFILYTSGSSGRPKGVVHAAGGFLTACAYSARQAFGVGPGMTLWCLAEPGWIMGHAYAVYAPLCLGAATLLYEGSPSHPQPDRLWRIAQKHQVATLITTPAVTGQLMREGEAWPAARDLPALRLVASVGEKLTPENRRWLSRCVAKGRAPVVDAWGQTETGGVLMISGSQGGLAPLTGVDLVAGQDQRLVLESPWPGLARSLVDGQALPTAGGYDTGDLARLSQDGKILVLGRSELAGCELPLVHVEEAVASHPDVAEAAAVGSGGQVVVYATLKAEAQDPQAAPADIAALVRRELPDQSFPLDVRVVEELPKTRSGKIARHALRQAAEGRAGDVSGLADPSVMTQLLGGTDGLF